MTRNEFEQLSGIYPTPALYSEIEKIYMDFDGDKQDFVKAFKKNKNFIASAAQTAAIRKAQDEQIAHEKEIASYEDQIKELYRVVDYKNREIADLQRQLNDLKVAISAARKIVNEAM